MEVKNSEQIERALQEWVSALDVLDDAIFIHDRECRVLRCNRAYQRLAALPFKQIIGQPYFKIFPKSVTPLAHCLASIDNDDSDENVDDITLDGIIYRSRFYTKRDEKGNYQYSIHILEDITREQADEEKLKQSEMFIKTVLDNLPIGIAVNTTSPEVKFSYMNDNFPKLYRTTRKALKIPDAFWKTVYENINLRKKLKKQVTEDTDSGDASRMHWNNIPITRQGEKTTYISAQNIPLPEIDSMISMVWDVTKRKQSEDLLRSEKQFSDKLIESLPDIFFLFNSEVKLERWNKKVETLFGMSHKELLDYDALSFIHPEDRPEIARRIEKTFKTGHDTSEARLVTKEGIRYYKFLSKQIKMPKGKGIIGIGIDVTKRREDELQLQRERDFSNKLIDLAPVIVLLLDPRGYIVQYNHYMEQLSGYSLQEVQGKEWFSLFLPEATRNKTKDIFLKAINNIDTQGQIDTILTRSGDALQIEWYSKTIRESDGKTEGLLAIGMDVTQRQASETALSRANRALKTLSAGNLALVHASSEDELLKEVTRVIVEVGGYSLASVDYAHDGPDKPLKPVAWSGFEGEEYWLHDLCWKETEQGTLPAGAAVREGVTKIYRNISDPTTCSIWRETSLERGYVSNISLPLFDGERAFGVLSIYSSKAESFDEEEVQLLEELATDLTYGILNQRIHASNRKKEILLREGLEQTILAMSATVESRDPYTAGHQKRVAELAAAIAEEMGLAQDEIDGIRFAAIIHDLGKIHIPAEILSKPGRLTDIEYNLIQTHSQAGYDIIKDVHFPWPIAQIILQHHERLDGSGYPQGLKGEEILLGAKIITVADVVEAISSHRPYRSAKGIEFALEEITKGRNIHYDAVVVDACLKLFNEKSFTFNTDSSMLQTI